MSVVLKTKGAEVPKDAVIISRDQALRYQMGLIKNWDNFWDVFALKAGPGISGGTAALSSFLINNHFRYKLRLGSYGRMSSYLAVVAAPTIVATLFHTAFIQSNIVLQMYDCPICLQTQAALIQGGSAVVYPFILAPLAGFMYATRHFTYRLPSITTQTKDVLKLWLKFTKSASTLGSALLIFNMLGAMLITSKEMKEHINISNKLTDYERRYDNDLLSDEEIFKTEQT